jgi:hypothetical protein
LINTVGKRGENSARERIGAAKEGTANTVGMSRIKKAVGSWTWGVFGRVIAVTVRTFGTHRKMKHLSYDVCMCMRERETN